LNTYKIIIQYKGTAYSGFQIQSDERTIQGEINQALKILSHSENVKSIGSGRTDAGVHAFAQVLKIEIPVNIPIKGLPKAMNSHLPADIRVIHAELCDSTFHPIYSAKSKEYNYVFSLEDQISPFASEFMTYFSSDLNIELMKNGCQLFCGEHDFINFQCTGTEIESTMRKIISCDIVQCNSSGHWQHVSENYFVLKVVGTGFLKQMVRLMMGALVSLGKGKISLDDLQKSLQMPLKNRLGPTAPPQGLYLKEVHY